MTDAEWNTCTDPLPMLRFLGARAGDRKLRLFLVACCRRVGHLFTREQVRSDLDLVEECADGRAGRGKLREALRAFHKARSAAPLFSPWERVLMTAGEAALPVIDADSCHHAHSAAEAAVYRGPGQPKPSPAEELRRIRLEEEAQCALVRDFFRPFGKKVVVDPQWLAWQGRTVVKLARAIYEDRRFADLPVLGDALEEAGCTDAEILGHCRGGGEHARGCWLIDLILSKDR
jgi:hypothetical protein